VTGLRIAYLKEELATSKLCAENKTLLAWIKVHKKIKDMFKKLFGKVYWIGDCLIMRLQWWRQN
jgi:hypothetical protein